MSTEKEDGRDNDILHATPLEDSPHDAGGIDLKTSSQTLVKQDKLDKQEFQERIKQKHREKRMKNKVKRKRFEVGTTSTQNVGLLLLQHQHCTLMLIE